MVFEGKGRIIQLSKGKIGIYVPKMLHKNFPFKPRQNVMAKIGKRKLIIDAHHEEDEKKK